MELLSIILQLNGLVWGELFVLSIFIFAIVAIIDIALNKFEGNQKIFWLLICIFVPFGGLIYFFIGRKQRIKT